jgi:hypothetical protein
VGKFDDGRGYRQIVTNFVGHVFHCRSIKRRSRAWHACYGQHDEVDKSLLGHYTA